MADIPVVYTLTVCPACDSLRASWKRQGIENQDIRVDQSQDDLNTALDYADTVPIIIYPDGRVEVGFEGQTG